MIRNERSKAALAALVFFVAAVGFAVIAIAEEDEVTLVGKVEVVTRDSSGDPELVAIRDADWGMVLVSNQGKGRALLRLVGERVRVQGLIFELEDDDGDFMYEVEVSSYEIEGSEPMDDDDQDDQDPDRS